MGRFYKTAKPGFIDDIIYQPPWELAKSVIDAQDTRIDKAEEDIDAYNTLTEDLENIKTDDPAVLEAIKGYRAESDKISQGMSGDYANYQKYLPQITSLQKRLKRDMSTGLVGRAGEALTQQKETEASLDELVKSKQISGERAAGLKKYYAGRYEEKGGLGYKDATTYNKYIDEELDPVKEFDTGAFQTQLKANFAADQSAWASSTPTGKFIITQSGTRQYIKEGAVEEYLQKDPQMEKFRRDVRQDAMVRGFNEGKRGAELDALVENTVKKAEEEFIEGTGELLSFEKVTAKEGAVANPYEYQKAVAETKQAPTVTVEVAADRRVGSMRDADSHKMSDVREKINAANATLPPEERLDVSTDEALLTTLNRHLKAGTLDTFVKKFGFANNDASLRKLIISTDKLGKTVSLVDPLETGETRPYKEQQALEVNIKHALENIDTAQQYPITTSDNYGIASEGIGATVMEMFKRKMITIDNIGGKIQKTKSKEIVPPIMETDADGNPYQAWYTSKGKMILKADSSKPKTEAEAKAIANAKGQSLATIDKVDTQEILGNKVGLVGSTVRRFKSSNGRVDNYEIEMTIQKIVDGKKVITKAVMQVPASHITAKL